MRNCRAKMRDGCGKREKKRLTEPVSSASASNQLALQLEKPTNASWPPRIFNLFDSSLPLAADCFGVFFPIHQIPSTKSLPRLGGRFAAIWFGPGIHRIVPSPARVESSMVRRGTRKCKKRLTVTQTTFLLSRGRKTLINSI